jgi:CRISPR-associated protein Csx17
MLEGALVLRVAALRKLDGAELAQAAAPFALRASNQGYGSAAPGDDSTRGEQWMPLWARPATKGEVEALFAEGRMKAGGAPAQNPLAAARAVARLGVARGVTSFTRFGYLVRNGLSNLAVPLGAFRVDLHPETRLLDEVDDWLQRYRRAASSKTAPASFERSYRRIEGHALAVCQHTAHKQDWEALLVALGDAEQELSRRAKATAESRLQPLPWLSPRWFDAADDGSPAMRIALAIASQWGGNGPRDDLGPIRVHCLPLDPDSGYRRFLTGADGLRRDRRVVWTGRDLVSDLAAVALRRAVEGRSVGRATFPLVGMASATLGDVSAFLEGRLDETRISELCRAFMAIDFSKMPRRPPRDGGLGLPLHALVRLCYLPWRLESFDSVPPRYDPTALRLLASGRLQDGVRMLLAQLVGMGMRPKIRLGAGDARFARRLAAAAAIPNSAHDLRRLRDLATKPFFDPSSSDPKLELP